MARKVTSSDQTSSDQTSEIPSSDLASSDQTSDQTPSDQTSADQIDPASEASETSEIDQTPASEAPASDPAIAPAMTDEAMEALVLKYLADKEAKAKAEKEARELAIAQAKALVDLKRTELESAMAALKLIAPAAATPMTGGKKARDLAIGNSRRMAPSAENSLGLTGTKLTLFNLLTQADGVSDEEGSEALGWQACAATLSKIQKLAEMAGLETSKAKGIDGKTRYMIHLA